MKEIKIALEYGCDPIWDISDPDNSSVNISADSLPITKELVNDIELWNKQFHDLHINNNIEFRYKGFDSEEDEKKFEELKSSILERLERELPSTWKIKKSI